MVIHLKVLSAHKLVPLFLDIIMSISLCFLLTHQVIIHWLEFLFRVIFRLQLMDQLLLDFLARICGQIFTFTELLFPFSLNLMFMLNIVWFNSSRCALSIIKHEVVDLKTLIILLSGADLRLCCLTHWLKNLNIIELVKVLVDLIILERTLRPKSCCYGVHIAALIVFYSRSWFIICHSRATWIEQALACSKKACLLIKLPWWEGWC